MMIVARILRKIEALKRIVPELTFNLLYSSIVSLSSFAYMFLSAAAVEVRISLCLAAQDTDGRRQIMQVFDCTKQEDGTWSFDADPSLKV